MEVKGKPSETKIIDEPASRVRSNVGKGCDVEMREGRAYNHPSLTGSLVRTRARAHAPTHTCTHLYTYTLAHTECANVARARFYSLLRIM